MTNWNWMQLMCSWKQQQELASGKEEAQLVPAKCLLYKLQSVSSFPTQTHRAFDSANGKTFFWALSDGALSSMPECWFLRGKQKEPNLGIWHILDGWQCLGIKWQGWGGSPVPFHFSRQRQLPWQWKISGSCFQANEMLVTKVIWKHVESLEWGVCS